MTNWPPRAFPLLAAAGLVGAAVACAINPHDALAAWLAAAVATSAVPIGALAVLLITYLVRGSWTDELHPSLTAAALTLPAAGLMFLPLLGGISWLYPWVQSSPHDTFKAIYLTPWFFVGRSVVYFATWTVIAIRARQAWGNAVQMVRVASIGLIIYALTASLAAIDWIESLTPEFHSSIYGLLIMAFQVLSGLSFGIAMAVRRSNVVPSYGALLLAMLLLWAYMHAMQYIIIWAGDIPDEVVWYLHREHGAWAVVLWTFVVLQFVVPFFALLMERVRHRPWPLLLIACATLGLRFVEAFLLVLPSADARGGVLWLALPSATAATVGILGVSWQFTQARMARSATDLRLRPADG